MAKEKSPGKTIKGKAKAEAVKLVINKNQKADGMTAEIHFAMTRTKKQCASLFGADFATLAFGSMIETEVEDGTETVHLAKSITAGARFRLGKHIVKFDGYEVIVTPKLEKVYPVEKSDKVVVAMRMPVHVGQDEKLGGRLVSLLAEQSVEIDFSPAQLDIPGTE